MCAIYTYHHTVEVRPVTKMDLFSSCRRLLVITAAEIIPLPPRVPLTTSQCMHTICISQTFPPVICVFPSSALNLKCLSKLKKTHLLISNRPLVVTALIKEWEQVLLLRTTTIGQQFAPEKPSQDLPNLKQRLLLPPKQLELSNWPPFKRLSADNIFLLYVDEEGTSSFSALYLNTPVHKICCSPHHPFFMYTKREVQFIQLLTFLCTSVPNGKIVISCPIASCPPRTFSFMAVGTCTLTADPALLSSSPLLLWTSASTVCHHPIHHRISQKITNKCHHKLDRRAQKHALVQQLWEWEAGNNRVTTYKVSKTLRLKQSSNWINCGNFRVGGFELNHYTCLGTSTNHQL